MRGQVTFVGKMIAIIMAVIMVVSPAYAGPKAWQISETNGEVSVETGDGVRTAARGQSLKAGDAVKTGASGRAVIVRGGEYVIVSPKSRVRITRPEETGAITQIFQSVGSALFRIEKKETPHFGVKTPYLAAVVKGTTFNVTVTEDGATVQVTEGRVEVSTLDGGASDMIVPGRIGRIDANDRQLLKVLGTDEKSIRSPLPAINVDSTAFESASATGSGGSASSDGGTERSDTNSSSTAPNNDFSDSAGNYSSSGFSGRIGTSINSEPVSIALATGGLISGNAAVERIAIRNASGGSTARAPEGGPRDSAGNVADDKGGNPDDKGGAPDDKGSNPDNKASKRDNKGSNPGDKGGNLGDKGKDPDDKDGNPDDKGGKRDKGKDPDDKGGNPGNKGDNPDDKAGKRDDKGGNRDDKGGNPGDKGKDRDDKGGSPGDKGGNPGDKGGNPGDDPSGKAGGKPSRT